MDVPIDVVVRPLVEADLEPAARVQIETFDAHDQRHGRAVPDQTSERLDQQKHRVRHFLTHDPAGAWAAELDGNVVGVALASKRNRLWGLSLLVVDTSLQSHGIGRRLLNAALSYADPDGPGVILSSSDPRAMHSYAAAGFDLHPQVDATGVVARERLRAPELPVREGGPDDFALADAVDLQVRGAPRGPDHQMLASFGPMLVVDSGASRGYAHLRGGRVLTLVATDEATASALLWRSLAHACDRGEPAQVQHIVGNQQWAVRAVVQAGLSLSTAGPAFWRGCAPPAAYLPSGAYL